VRLFDPDKRDFEISLTVDVSTHGALVVCKNPRQPNVFVSVHSMGGNMFSSARVVHCQPLRDRSYAVGLELADPLPDWLEIQRAATPDGQALNGWAG
jgi:PilZ domain